MRRPPTLAGLLAGVASGTAAAHGGGFSDATLPHTGWSFDLWVVLPLAAAWVIYLVGLYRLWDRAGPGRGVRRLEATAFMTGCGALVIALVTPLDALADHLFFVHMIQHEVLMVVAAPLLVLGRPIAVWSWAMPRAIRTSVARVLHAPWRAVTGDFTAWWIHALAIWGWHIPVLFRAALTSEAVHFAQHASFLGSALVFWWAVLPRRNPRATDGRAMLWLFTTMLHTGLLGALLTFAPAPLYLTDRVTLAHGWSALEDQQLGGLIMWIPAALAYPVAALALLAQWLQNDSSAGTQARHPEEVAHTVPVLLIRDGDDVAVRTVRTEP